MPPRGRLVSGYLMPDLTPTDGSWCILMPKSHRPARLKLRLFFGAFLPLRPAAPEEA